MPAFLFNSISISQALPLKKWFLQNLLHDDIQTDEDEGVIPVFVAFAAVCAKSHSSLGGSSWFAEEGEAFNRFSAHPSPVKTF